MVFSTAPYKPWFFHARKRPWSLHQLIHHWRLRFVMLGALISCFLLFHAWILPQLISKCSFLLSYDGSPAPDNRTKLELANEKKLAKSSFPLLHDGSPPPHYRTKLELANEKQVLSLNESMNVDGFFGVQHTHLLRFAARDLAKKGHNNDLEDLWGESPVHGFHWRPCAGSQSLVTTQSNNGYITVSANGGLNQQRVAICNAVAVARLLNATLVIPKFLYSSVWRDDSQFGDIYQEDYFIHYLKDDITIVKELPADLQSLDLEAIGSFFSDMEIKKEAKTSFYMSHVLPVLLQNRVVHFYAFGHKLSFDHVPFHIQRLRCKCNFHALKFSRKIQKTADLMISRLKQKMVPKANMPKESPSRLLAIHLRFEIDMAAYSLCEFGGGESEKRELDAYREIHFPALAMSVKNEMFPSASRLRDAGKCPMTPEEVVLMLVSLGFKRDTQIYLAGAKIFGGSVRMHALTSLYPNIVTKENLLSLAELQPFTNKSSQLAALDFIVCTSADTFAMSDSGSQFSSLASGFRMYYGGKKLPTIRPNKQCLGRIFSRSLKIGWKEVKQQIKKSIMQTKNVHLQQIRPPTRSIYRHPRSLECMCKA